MENSKLDKPEMGGDTLGCIFENATVDSVSAFIGPVAALYNSQCGSEGT